MTDRLKCPICGGEMIGNIGSPICHYNQDCPIHDRSIPQEIYDLLERTRKALDKALHYLDAEYYAHIIVNKKEPELIAKVLDEIKTVLEQGDEK